MIRPEQPTQSRQDQSLSTLAVRGVFWTGSSIAVQLVVTLVFFRVLSPELMGQFQAALIAVVLFGLIGDLGLGAALVQFRQAEDRHFDAAFWTSFAFGLLLVAVAVALAPLIARFTEDAAAFERAFLPLTALLPFAAVSGIGRARLQRQLRFRTIALVEISATAAAALTGVIVLVAGGGIWSPVLNAVVREIGHCTGLWAVAGWWPRLRFRLADLRRLLFFGLNTTGANLVNYLNNNLDYLFVLYFLGYETLGYYAFAYRCTMQPYSRVASAIARVCFPAFATVQKDDELLRRGYLKAVSGSALVAWPLLMGMLVFADEIVRWVRPDLLPGVSAFRLLALASLFKAVGTAVGSVFLAKGKAHWAFRWTLFSLAVLLPGFYFGVTFGPAGVAAALLLLSALFLPISQYLINGLIGLRFPAYLRALSRPAMVALWVLAAMAVCKIFAPDSRLHALLLAGSAGLAAYLLGLRLFAGDLCRQYWRSIKGPGHPGQPPLDV